MHSTVFYTTEANGSRPVHAWSHQQVLAIGIDGERARKIPLGARGTVIAASFEHSCPRVLIYIFIRPLPDISYHIHYAKWARPPGICVYIGGRPLVTRGILGRHPVRISIITPGV